MVKLSEFIKKLRDVRSRYGDLDVKNSTVAVYGTELELKTEDDNPF